LLLLVALFLLFLLFLLVFLLTLLLLFLLVLPLLALGLAALLLLGGSGLRGLGATRKLALVTFFAFFEDCLRFLLAGCKLGQPGGVAFRSESSLSLITLPLGLVGLLLSDALRKLSAQLANRTRGVSGDKTHLLRHGVALVTHRLPFGVGGLRGSGSSGGGGSLLRTVDEVRGPLLTNTYRQRQVRI
jgi:hypothetical protein